jgi:2-oxoglutarate ferredoxin oxidoreductase subunit gamma
MGGQGIIFAGIVLARSAALYQKKEGKGMYAIQTQSYGPAARGESSKCDVMISDDPDFYPFVQRPDFMVVMSQPAFDKYIEQTYPGTIVLLDEDAVERRPDLTYYAVDAIRRAEKLGKLEAANMVMLGALIQISGAVSRDAGLRAIVDLSPLGSAEVNERAFREGYAIGKSFQSEG